MLENNIELELLYIEGNDFYMKKNNRMIKRQYTLTCEDDFVNIRNGLCPDYALHWPNKENAKYWPANHDFQGSLEKRLTNYHLKRVIRDNINIINQELFLQHYTPQQPQLYHKDIKNNYPFHKIKKVQFNIFNDIIFFDDDYSTIEQL
jgi:hypothetical protein